jgi:hypothetical protein
MKHWSEQYIGRRYIEGKFDCADMACLVQKEVFKRTVQIPGSRNYIGLKGSARQQAQMNQIQSEIQHTVERTDQPKDGDAVLMIGRGYTNHIGVYCVIGHEAYVLHASKGYGQSVLSRLRDITPIHGLKIEGFYRWL